MTFLLDDVYQTFATDLWFTQNEQKRINYEGDPGSSYTHAIGYGRVARFYSWKVPRAPP